VAGSRKRASGLSTTQGSNVARNEVQTSSKACPDIVSELQLRPRNLNDVNIPSSISNMLKHRTSVKTKYNGTAKL
jgi:hypothetical protein